jgi:adenylosuccinate lyase
MIKRYSNEKLTALWSNENKVAMWLEVELAVIEARESLGIIPVGTYDRIKEPLNARPVEIVRWLAFEKELHHDLNAFVKERKENLQEELRRYFHDGITSYDTEEPAFALILADSCECVFSEITLLESEIIRLAKKYCFTPMNARTHGQEAEMQSFGARCLTWLVELRLGKERLVQSVDNLHHSRLSGAIGKYNDKVTPDLEKVTLGILGLEPFYGATQVAPRSLYLPTAQALCEVVQAVNKIAHDIRLSARSGKPLMQEPFGKMQTGSSAMPQKKNTILTERIAGMERLARGYLHAIEENSFTWEERAIEQSSCERVAWPDLFHVTVYTLQTLTKVLRGLQVYPDNMLWEIINSRGCYAAGQAKDWLKEKGSVVGIDEESAYRIVQLAAFNAHEPNVWAKEKRAGSAASLEEADSFLGQAEAAFAQEVTKDMRMIIARCSLKTSDQLAAQVGQVDCWNDDLKNLFSDKELVKDWMKLFKPSYLLRHEPFLFQKILGWTPGDLEPGDLE